MYIFALVIYHSYFYIKSEERKKKLSIIDYIDQLFSNIPNSSLVNILMSILTIWSKI